MKEGKANNTYSVLLQYLHEQSNSTITLIPGRGEKLIIIGLEIEANIIVCTHTKPQLSNMNRGETVNHAYAICNLPGCGL